MSWNEGLPWTEEFIEKYVDKWDWSGLSNNEKLPWTEELIEQYKDKWNLFGSVCIHESYSDILKGQNYEVLKEGTDV